MEKFSYGLEFYYNEIFSLEDEKLYQAVLNETMLNKWASPEEIADLAYYLTVINKSMTGQDLLIDNGEALKANFIW